MEGRRLFHSEFIRCPPSGESGAVDRVEGTLPLARSLTLPMGKESISTSQRQGQRIEGEVGQRRAVDGMRSASWQGKMKEGERTKNACSREDVEPPAHLDFAPLQNPSSGRTGRG